MKKIESFEQYVELTKLAMIRKLKNINCFLMPDETKELISQNKLFYIENENVLELIIKRDRYTKVFWYSNENFIFLPFDNDVEIITDLPYSIKKSERYIEFASKLKNEGFEIYSTNSRMSAKAEDYTKVFNYDENIKIIPMREKDIDLIYDLWEENFDYIANLLYSKQEIRYLNETIYVCMNSNNDILGAMALKLTNNSGTISKIAVFERYKGCGIGSIMEYYYINKCKSLGINNLLLYTVDTNTNGINFHKKFGFEPDGKNNEQYIYRRK